MKKVIIIGAGPAGLTAGYDLLSKSSDYEVTIVEESSVVGGLCARFENEENVLDAGGHMLISNNPAVKQFWGSILPPQGVPSKDDKILDRYCKIHNGGPDPDECEDVILSREKLTRIYKDNKFYESPIKFNKDAVKNFGIATSIKSGFSQIGGNVFKHKELSLEDYCINRYGKQLYSMFIEEYLEKIWGKEPSRINADFGVVAERSMIAPIISTEKKENRDYDKLPAPYAARYYYPKYGAYQLWESVADRFIEMGGSIHKNCKVTGINTLNDRIRSVSCSADGDEFVVNCDYLISSMPIRDLILGMDNVDSKVSLIAENLSYRGMVSVLVELTEMKWKNDTEDYLSVDNMIPDSVIYISNPNVKVSRIQVYNNFSPYMVRNPEHFYLGLNYYCNEGDYYWSMGNRDWRKTVINDLQKLGIIDSEASVVGYNKTKYNKAFPSYYDGYDNFDKIKTFLNGFENLYCVGRNGQHRFSSIDESMKTSFEAVKNILGLVRSKDNIWNANEKVDGDEKVYNSALLAQEVEYKGNYVPLQKKIENDDNENREYVPPRRMRRPMMTPIKKGDPNKLSEPIIINDSVVIAARPEKSIPFAAPEEEGEVSFAPAETFEENKPVEEIAASNTFEEYKPAEDEFTAFENSISEEKYVAEPETVTEVAEETTGTVEETVAEVVEETAEETVAEVVEEPAEEITETVEEIVEEPVEKADEEAVDEVVEETAEEINITVEEAAEEKVEETAAATDEEIDKADNLEEKAIEEKKSVEENGHVSPIALASEFSKASETPEKDDSQESFSLPGFVGGVFSRKTINANNSRNSDRRLRNERKNFTFGRTDNFKNEVTDETERLVTREQANGGEAEKERVSFLRVEKFESDNVVDATNPHERVIQKNTSEEPSKTVLTVASRFKDTQNPEEMAIEKSNCPVFVDKDDDDELDKLLKLPVSKSKKSEIKDSFAKAVSSKGKKGKNTDEKAENEEIEAASEENDNTNDVNEVIEETTAVEKIITETEDLTSKAFDENKAEETAENAEESAEEITEAVEEVTETEEEKPEEVSFEETAEETFEESAAEPESEEVTEEISDEPAVEDIAEGSFEEAEEAAEEMVKEPATEEAAEDTITEAETEEIAEETFEEPETEEAAEETFEESSVEETIEESAVEENTEATFEESANEETTEDTIEESAVEENTEAAFEEPAFEEVTEETFEETATEETTEETFEEPAFEEVTEETFEEPATEETTEETFEEPATEETTEETFEESAIEETAEEAFEEPAFEEVAEESFEEPAAEEAFEEPVIEEAAEETFEEPAFEEVAEESFEEPVAEESFEEPAAEESFEEPAAEEAFEEPAVEETAAEPSENDEDNLSNINEQAASKSIVKSWQNRYNGVGAPAKEENQNDRVINRGDISSELYGESFAASLKGKRGVMDYMLDDLDGGKEYVMHTKYEGSNVKKEETPEEKPESAPKDLSSFQIIKESGFGFNQAPKTDSTVSDNNYTGVNEHRENTDSISPSPSPVRPVSGPKNDYFKKEIDTSIVFKNARVIKSTKITREPEESHHDKVERKETIYSDRQKVIAVIRNGEVIPVKDRPGDPVVNFDKVETPEPAVSYEPFETKPEESFINLNLHSAHNAEETASIEEEVNTTLENTDSFTNEDDNVIEDNTEIAETEETVEVKETIKPVKVGRQKGKKKKDKKGKNKKGSIESTDDIVQPPISVMLDAKEAAEMTEPLESPIVRNRNVKL